MNNKILVLGLLLLMGVFFAQIVELKVITVNSGPAGISSPSVSGVRVWERSPTTGLVLDSGTTTTDGVSLTVELNKSFYVTTAGASGSAIGGSYGFYQELSGGGVPSFKIEQSGDTYKLCRLSNNECSYGNPLLILYKLRDTTPVANTTNTPERVTLKVIAVETGPAGVLTPSVSGVRTYVKSPSTGQTITSGTTTNPAGVSFSLEVNQQFYITTAASGALGGEYGFYQEQSGGGVPSFVIRKTSGEYRLCRVSDDSCSSSLELILYRIRDDDIITTTTDTTPVANTTETVSVKVIAVETGPASLETRSDYPISVYMRDPSTGRSIDSGTTNSRGVVLDVELNRQFYVTTSGSSGAATGGTYGFYQELDGNGVPVFVVRKVSGVNQLCRVSDNSCSNTIGLILYKLTPQTTTSNVTTPVQNRSMPNPINTAPVSFGVGVNNYPDSPRDSHNINGWVNAYKIISVSPGDYRGVLISTMRSPEESGARFSVNYGDMVDFLGFKSSTNAAAMTSYTFTTPSYRHFGNNMGLCQINYSDTSSILVSGGRQSCATSLSVPYIDVGATSDYEVDENEQTNVSTNQSTSQPPNENNYVLEAKAGWNLLSVPFQSGVINNTNCANTKIYLYDSINRQYITSYLTPGNTVGFNYMGFWLKQANGCKITITPNGRYYYSSDIPSIVAAGGYQLKQGWNLIGVPLESVAYSNIAGTCIATSGPWSFDPTTNEWKAARTFNSGLGYFVKMKNSCHLGVVEDMPPLPE